MNYMRLGYESLMDSHLIKPWISRFSGLTYLYSQLFHNQARQQEKPLDRKYSSCQYASFWVIVTQIVA